MAKPTLEFRTPFGAYRAIGVLGQGGAGTVHAALDEQGKTVAVKVLDPSKATRDRLKRFKNEYLFGTRVEHPNLIRVLDSGLLSQPRGEAPFYVMPQYGQSLRKLIGEDSTQDQKLSIFALILNGVEAAHLNKVVHRDLKPENILANSATDLVVADFGIARFEEEDLYTAVETRNERLANFVYSAPEQRKRGSTSDERADIFALGLILNELFTSDVPQGTGYSTIAAKTPAYGWLDEVVAEMIRSLPGDRPPTIAAVRQRLQLHAEQFATRQKIDALSKQVVPASTVDDRLAVEPPRIIDVDYDAGTLIITLDKPVTQGWVEALRNIGNYTSVMNAGPDRFQFNGVIARVSVGPESAQQAINYFKEWLPRASAKYAQNLAMAARAEEERQREMLDRQRAALEQRAKLRSSLEF